MALKAGRRGLHKRLVDAFGNFNGEAPSVDYYTKQQTDDKFETKTHVNNTFQKKTLEVPLEMLSGSKLTVEDALHGLNEELTELATLKTEVVTLNGIEYRAIRSGKYVQIVAKSGSLTEAYTAYTKVISLSDFSIFDATEVMYDSYAIVTEGTSIKARVYVDSGNLKQLFMNSNIEAGVNIRFCFSTYLR